LHLISFKLYNPNPNPSLQANDDGNVDGDDDYGGGGDHGDDGIMAMTMMMLLMWIIIMMMHHHQHKHWPNCYYDRDESAAASFALALVMPVDMCLYRGAEVRLTGGQESARGGFSRTKGA
jgi:hypothetical protein